MTDYTLVTGRCAHVMIRLTKVIKRFVSDYWCLIVHMFFFFRWLMVITISRLISSRCIRFLWRLLVRISLAFEGANRWLCLHVVRLWVIYWLDIFEVGHCCLGFGVILWFSLLLSIINYSYCFIILSMMRPHRCSFELLVELTLIEIHCVRFALDNCLCVIELLHPLRYASHFLDAEVIFIVIWEVDRAVS